MGDALSSKPIHLGNKYNQCPELGIKVADGSKWCFDIFKLHDMQYADLVSDWKSPEWDLFRVEGRSLENCKNYQEYYDKNPIPVLSITQSSRWLLHSTQIVMEKKITYSVLEFICY